MTNKFSSNSGAIARTPFMLTQVHDKSIRVSNNPVKYRLWVRVLKNNGVELFYQFTSEFEHKLSLGEADQWRAHHLRLMYLEVNRNSILLVETKTFVTEPCKRPYQSDITLPMIFKNGVLQDSI